MKSDFFHTIIILLLLNTVLFAAEILAPGKDNAVLFEPYFWVFDGTLDDYCWKAVGLNEGQHYYVLPKRQLQNPGTTPVCTVEWIKEQLGSHGFGVVWWAAHANGGPGNEPDRISAEAYELSPAGQSARDSKYNYYVQSYGWGGKIIAGSNIHAYSIAIRAEGFQSWFKQPSTLDSALVYLWGCKTVFLSDDCGAGVFLGYDVHIYLSSPWGADVFWQRMNGEHGVNFRNVASAVSELAGGHLKYNPNYAPYLDMVLAPYVEFFTFGAGDMSGSVWFDISMNSTQYDPEDVISVTGADIINAYWSYYDKKLNFEIANVTQNTQYYTVHYDKAIARALSTTIRLDGNQNPPGTNGHGPNCDDYKFIGHAQTGIEEIENVSELCYVTSLKTISPNPGRDKIHLSYQIANPTITKITIFDCTGRVIENIEINDNPGQHTFIWDGVDEMGRTVENGCYFVKFEAGDYKAIKKFVLVK